MTKVYDSATDLITFARSSSGTALRRVGYGDELVTNGTFDADTDWTKGVGWTIGSGTANKAAGIGDAITQANGSMAEGHLYAISYTVSGSTTGVCSAILTAATQVTGNLVGGNGDRTEYLRGTSGVDGFGITANASFDGSIDNISVREVIFDRATDPLVLFNHPDDIPRIEYGSDGSLKGLLIEEQRTNLVTYSEDFSQSYWTKINTATLSLDATGPDGQTSAVTLVDSGATGTGGVYVQSNVTVATSTAYTFSCFAKADQLSCIRIFLSSFTTPANGEVYFDLSNGLVGTEDTGLTGNIEDFGSGWYRCSVTFTTDATDTSGFIVIQVANSDGDVTVDLDGTSSVHLYGAQLEEGSFPTSYIPTSGSTVTRSPDIASIPVSAFGYNQEAGTVVVSFDTFQDPGDTGSRFVASVGTDGRFCYINGDYAKAYDGTNVVSGGQLYNPGAFTTATAFGASSTSMSLDGGSAVTGSFDGSWGSGGDLMLGHLSNANHLNGHIKSLSYFPRRLTDAQLQELTS